MEDDDRLKHCPFCGGNAEFEELEDDANFGGLVVTCLTCLACSRVQFGEDRMNLLLEAWNRRTQANDNDALTARVRELEAALRPFVADGIDQACDECGGDDSECPEDCAVRVGRAALGE